MIPNEILWMKNLYELNITGNHFSKIPSFLKYLNLSELKTEWPLYIENDECPPVDDFLYGKKQYTMNLENFKKAIELAENDGRAMVSIKDYHLIEIGQKQNYNILTYLNFCIAAIRK